jgi:hypothetical protein
MNNAIGALQHVWVGGWWLWQDAQTTVDHEAPFLHFLKP